MLRLRPHSLIPVARADTGISTLSLPLHTRLRKSPTTTVISFLSFTFIPSFNAHSLQHLLSDRIQHAILNGLELLI
jgi:hypothetical protein